MPLRHEEIRDRFHLELGRFVHAYARFDLNVGMQLNLNGLQYGVEVSDVLIGKVPLAHRLDRLKEQTLKIYASAGDAAIAEFEAWFAKAGEIKAIRNDYVHARWGLPGITESDDPVLKMLPMNWNFDPDNLDTPTDVTISALAKQTAAIEKLIGELMKLQKKYQHHVAPTIAMK